MLVLEMVTFSSDNESSYLTMLHMSNSFLPKKGVI